MSQNNVVTFKVAGNDLLSYFDQVKKRSNDLTNSLISGAKLEEGASKNQIKLIEQQIAAIERKNRLQNQLSGLIGIGNATQRIGNIEKRDATLDALFQSTEQKYKNKDITKSDYESRLSRLSSLSNQNSPDAITGQFKEYFTKQKEQNQLLLLQTKLSKEQIITAKDTSRENVQAIMKGDRSLEDVILKASTPAEKLSAEMTRDRLSELQGEKKKEESNNNDGFKSLIGGYLGVSTITSLLSNAATLGGTKSGFDVIGKVEQLKGSIAGTVIGTVLGAVGGSFIGGAGAFAGAAAGASAGNAIGSAFGSTEGEFIQRRAISMQDYLATRNAYSATTGYNQKDIANRNMEDYGLSDKTFIDLIRSVSRTTGTNKNADREASSQYYLEKGYGVDSGTTNSVLELLRSSKEANRNVGALVAGILQKGQGNIFKNGDNSFLNEFLTKFTSLQKSLLQTSRTIDSGTAFGLLKQFDSIGGYFSARDSRSMPLINQINSSLINPQSEGAKGLSFLSLRQANPDMSSYDLRKEQQKGLGSDKYFNAVVTSLDRLGGDENYKKFQFASMLGLGNNLEAAEDLYKNRHSKGWKERLGGIEDFSADISTRAKDNTTLIEKETAKLNNALLKTVTDNVTEMKDAFSEAMREVASNFVVTEGVDRRLRLTNTPIQRNVTKTPSKTQRENGLTADDRPNPRSAMNRL